MNDLRFLGKPAPLQTWVQGGKNERQHQKRAEHLEGAIKEAAWFLRHHEDLSEKDKEDFRIWALSKRPLETALHLYVAFLLRKTLGEVE